MANQDQNGGRNIAIPDEHRPSWRPEDVHAQGAHRGNEDDHDYRSWRDRNYRDADRYEADRDPRRWEGGRGSELGYGSDVGRSTERYGQGPSGYGAGRYGDDRSPHLPNRNAMVPSPGSFEDRRHHLGVDDGFTGRGNSGYWQDRGGHESERYGAQGGYGRGFEAERVAPSSQRGSEWRGGSAEWRGYEQNPGRVWGYDPRMGYQDGSGQGAMGYQNTAYGRSGAPAEPLRAEPHVHRGTGPHRGKGPLGYQRSDERIHEMVCEALTDDDQIDASHIQVTVKDGDVTLSGTVDDRRTRRDAEDCVASVPGVRDVQVHLRLRDDRQLSRTGQPTSSSSPVQNGFGKTEPEAPQLDKKPRA